MGTREDMQADLAAAFDDPDGLGPAVVQAVLTDRAGATHPTRGVKETISAREADGESVQVGDGVWTILQNELAATPEIDDTLTTPDGTVHHIYDPVPDPMGVQWEIYTRA